MPIYAQDDNNTVYHLDYRVVETAVNIYRGGDTNPLLVLNYTALKDNGDGRYAYEAIASALFKSYYSLTAQSQPINATVHKNQLETTSITVSKTWVNDNNTVTKPDRRLLFSAMTGRSAL